MLSDPVLQWALTLTFSATAMYATVRLLADRKLLPIVGNALHLVMGLVMVAMCWPWWSLLPAIPQTLCFSAGAVWFVAIAILQVRRRITRAAVGGHSAWHQAAHAVMMLAMVWMILAMPSGTDATTHAHHHGGLEPWAAASGVAITAALVTSGVIFLVELISCLRGRTNWLGHTGDVASGVLMSFGMAAMCWPMITG
ncbi:DUF5134 domain-containing protein [Leucobacter sp. G161]|uniref:DUF5134 domain-containing protein n=1 Tax=Leucobacter sp. G161 TaxID=663704 RepID=UPI00073BCA8C|nr:DUF5134 domain-containing protein [Leucobacter sp. G161]KUF06078.1 hypothetical protein AUL38_14365 [Leucobacter sp. G161]